MSRVLALDAGTTGVTALVVDETVRVLGRGYREVPQHYPRPGWVEHDPEEIWQATLGAAQEALERAQVRPRDLAAIGLTNQRETAVLWERATLRPVHRAIVWQDRRTAARCAELAGEAPLLRRKTGLTLDPYFSATKVEWLLANVEGAADLARQGRLAFGTVDSWLLARLSGGAVHATDPSNASRTLLYDIYERRWDPELLDRFGVPASILPEVHPSSGRFRLAELLGARVPVSGVAGDQQAALFGQACFSPGMSKNTYGTGSFVLMNVGETPPPPPEGLLVTIAWSLGGRTTYALEGAIFVTGAALQWLRDGLGILAQAAEAGPLAGSVADAGGVVFVPALAGLGSPWWDPWARGAIFGLTRGTTRAHLVRAAIEAMAYQTRDVVEAMAREARLHIDRLRVDGGASVMDLLCQLQADQLGVAVDRPAVTETTALGAALLAGLGEGVWGSLAQVAQAWRLEKSFSPSADRARAEPGYQRWRRALERSRGWEQPSTG